MEATTLASEAFVLEVEFLLDSNRYVEPKKNKTRSSYNQSTLLLSLVLRLPAFFFACFPLFPGELVLIFSDRII